MFFIFIFSIFIQNALAQVNDLNFWKAGRELPNVVGEKWATGNANIFNDSPAYHQEQIASGQSHAIFYPVDVTGMLMPYQALMDFFNNQRGLVFLKSVLKTATQFNEVSDLYKHLGLNPFPKNDAPQFNLMRVSELDDVDGYLGATLIERNGIKGLTFGCAACHSGQLFGKTILGLSNRFPKANRLFKEGQLLARYVNEVNFADAMQATEAEIAIYTEARRALKYVGVKEPAVLGLDASLTQVGLSLGIRDKDEFATMSPHSWKDQDKKLNLHPLSRHVADSKPSVWWNVKYKTKFLSDGSLVSGNPLYTVILWNEIGRGVNLKKLSNWLKQNEQTIMRELTVAVFAAKAPRYTDFFGNNSINVMKAKQGQKHFIKNCQGCHGVYEKNWEVGIQTTRVLYHRKTPVIDVGTDPNRYEGMKYFAEDLNRLQILKESNNLVVVQKGYVPPPLEGIWARYPYFHNNAAPSLCSVLTPGSMRPKTYWAGPADNPNTDYDAKCAGYPKDYDVPAAWKKNREWFFDSSKPGLSNSGHDKKILVDEMGQEKLSLLQKMELIEFLKTL